MRSTDAQRPSLRTLLSRGSCVPDGGLGLARSSGERTRGEEVNFFCFCSVPGNTKYLRSPGSLPRDDKWKHASAPLARGWEPARKILGPGIEWTGKAIVIPPCAHRCTGPPGAWQV